MITLADKSSYVKPLLQTPIVNVIPVAIANDGTVLKAELRFDKHIKRAVGFNVDVHLVFALDNPQANI